jgi:mono/diheme cytochrome c family protein
MTAAELARRAVDRLRHTLLTVCAVALPLALSGCGGAGESPAPSSFTGASGAELYAQACASCHGADLYGTDQGPPFIDALYRPGHHADAAFLLAARRGVRAHHWDFGDMPLVEGLSDEQLAAIVGYVRERQRTEGIE